MKLLFFIIINLTAFLTSAQDPIYVLENRSAIIFNPALTGIKNNGRASLNYQSFWDKYESSPFLANVSFDQKFSKLHGGIGGFVSHDYYSIFNRTNFGINYAYQTSINRKLNLSIGLSGVLTKQRLNIHALPSYTTYPIPPINTDFYNFRASLGTFLFGERFFWGTSIHNLSSLEIPIRFSTQLGYTFSISKSKYFSLTPTLAYEYQSKNQSLLAKVNLTYKWIHLGFGYRNGESILIMAGIDYKRFSFNYGFSQKTDQTIIYQIRTHQVGVQFNLPQKAHCWRLKNSFNTYLF